MPKCNKCNDDNKDNDEIIELKCKHVFCWNCFEEHVKENLKPKIPCPCCDKTISDTQLRKGVSEELINKYEMVCLGLLDTSWNMGTIKCVVEDCPFVTNCASSYMMLDCDFCGVLLCVACDATHRYLSCEEYERRQNDDDVKALCNVEYDRARKVVIEKLRVLNGQKISEIAKTDIWDNVKPSNCAICYKSLGKGLGVTLRLGDDVCKSCIVSHITTSNSLPIKVPSDNGLIEEKEIKALLNNQELKVYLSRCINELVIPSTDLGRLFSCKDGDCGFICYLAPSTTDVNRNKPITNFKCPRCNLELCLKCNESHSSAMTCVQYAESIKDTQRGRYLLDIEKRIKEKKLMRCVNCFTLLTKISGCNWIQCHICKLELCWILQMRRWGPNGRGDTSGGCKCCAFSPYAYCSPECTLSCAPHNG